MRQYSKILFVLLPILFLGAAVPFMGVHRDHSTQAIHTGYKVSFSGFAHNSTVSATYQSHAVEETEEFNLSEKKTIIFDQDDAQYKVSYSVNNDMYDVIELTLLFDQDIVAATVKGGEAREKITVDLNGVPLVEDIPSDWSGRFSLKDIPFSNEICIKMQFGELCHAKHKMEVPA